MAMQDDAAWSALPEWQMANRIWLSGEVRTKHLEVCRFNAPAIHPQIGTRDE